MHGGITVAIGFIIGYLVGQVRILRSDERQLLKTLMQHIKRLQPKRLE
jgi:hypothetical protein